MSGPELGQRGYLFSCSKQACKEDGHPLLVEEKNSMRGKSHWEVALERLKQKRNSILCLEKR